MIGTAMLFVVRDFSVHPFCTLLFDTLSILIIGKCLLMER